MSEKSKIGALMAARGGIAGMQASLDAAAAGYKFYLVERDISIGVVVAQPDKTFATNDGSTCLISSKLIEVARYPDIEIIIQADLEAREELPASPWGVDIIAIGQRTDVKIFNEADGIALTPEVRNNFPRRCYLETAGKGFLIGLSSAFS